MRGMRGTPLISMRVPPRTLTLTSSRAAPIPVRTCPVLRTRRRRIWATSATSCGRAHVGAGHGLDERHAQAVGQVDAAVADVADLAAGVLLEAELDDGDAAVLVRDPAVDADDGRALEAGRDAAVEVLLAGDVELVDEGEVVEHGHAEGDVEGLVVHHERRRVVHLVGADRLPVDPVDDLLLGLELHEGRAVVLAELGQGRPHVAEDLGVVLVAVAAGRAAAEELLFGQELLVDLEAGAEADLGVIRAGHLGERLEDELIFAHGKGASSGTEEAL